MKQARIKKLVKKDWITRMDFKKRDSSWMAKHRKQRINNEEGA